MFNYKLTNHYDIALDMMQKHPLYAGLQMNLAIHEQLEPRLEINLFKLYTKLQFYRKRSRKSKLTNKKHLWDKLEGEKEKKVLSRKCNFIIYSSSIPNEKHVT